MRGSLRQGSGHRRAAVGRIAAAVAIVTTAVWSTAPAGAADGPAPSSAHGYDAGAVAERAQQLLQDGGTERQAARSDGPPPALASGDCGETTLTDADEGFIVDIAEAGLFADCSGDLGVGVVTHDEWDVEALDGLITGIDVDFDETTGCVGFDYSVVVVPFEGQLEGFVFPETDTCDEWGEPTGSAVGVRFEGDRSFVAMFFESSAIGSPESFGFVVATKAVSSDEFDYSPDPGSNLAVMTITDGEPPPPTPQARPIGPACTFEGGFEDGFADVPSSNSHEAAIDCIVYWQVTTGLRPGVYHPSGGVTREQMASFLARFIEQSGGSLPSDPPDAFPDDDGSPHEPNIDKLAAAGITTGLPDGRFDPRGTVTRAQMATFIVRALEYRIGGPLTEGTAADYFTDDDGNNHEPNINKAAQIGITGGTSGTAFGPHQLVRRDQMASFLARGLAELVDRRTVAPPPPPPKCESDPTIERTDAACAAG